MATNRKRKKRLLIDFGLTAEEIQVVEELAARQNLNITQVVRDALRLYKARDAGFVVCKSAHEPIGCPDFD